MKHAAKSMGFFILVLFSFALAGDLRAQDGDTGSYTKEKVRQMYVDYLTGEGYQPTVSKEGGLVIFKREGRTYCVSVPDSDFMFFTVVLANIWPIENQEERLKVLAAADASNAKTKVCKVHTVDNNVWVTIELFVEKPEDFKAVFKRSMSAVDRGVANFVAKMKE
jgi:hypothetical protein